MGRQIKYPQEINKICRTCLKVANDNELFVDRIVENDQPTYLCEMLESLTNVKVDMYDGLPQSLCTQCVQQLTNAYSFKNNCSETYQGFRQVKRSMDFETSNTISFSECLSDGILYTTMQLKAGEPSTDRSVCYIHTRQKIIEGFNCCINDRDKSGIKIVMCIPTRHTSPQKTTDNSLPSINKSVSDVGDPAVAKCDTCGAELGSHICNSIENPFEEILGNNPIIKCPWCPEQYCNMILFSLHFLKHAFTFGMREKIIYCISCEKIFGNMDLMARHYLEGVCTDKGWKCSICDIRFPTGRRLLQHNDYHTFGDELIACLLCEEAYFNKETLNNHLLKHWLW